MVAQLGLCHASAMLANQLGTVVCNHKQYFKSKHPNLYFGSGSQFCFGVLIGDVLPVAL